MACIPHHACNDGQGPGGELPSPKRKVSSVEVFGALPNMDMSSIQHLADVTQRLTRPRKDTTFPIFWDQMLLFFECAVSANFDGVAAALAVKEQGVRRVFGTTIPVEQGTLDTEALNDRLMNTKLSGTTGGAVGVPTAMGTGGGGDGQIATPTTTTQNARFKASHRPLDSGDLAVIGSHRCHHLNPIEKDDLKPIGKLVRSERYMKDIEQVRDPRRIMREKEEALEMRESLTKTRERRIERQKELAATARKPSIASKEQRRICGLCQLDFDTSALATTVSVSSLFSLLQRMERTDVAPKYETRLSSSAMSKFQRVQLCAFCSQFFDPDAPDGLALRAGPFKASKSTNSKAARGYIGRGEEIVPFFDERYPDRYSGEAHITEQLPQHLKVRARGPRNVCSNDANVRKCD